MPRLTFKPPPPPADGPVLERLRARPAAVGGGVVLRALPHPKRRLIGAWCFLDHFGPTDGVVAVGPHPHIGLQTVTWLISGRIRHRDSLGTDQIIDSGQLNWMTAGRGIAHSEDTVPGPSKLMHGVQLWVALPDSARHNAPEFQHIAQPPTLRVGGAAVTLLAGAMAGVTCPARTFSPLIGADIVLGDDQPVTVPLDPSFEHGLVVLDGSAEIDGARVEPGELVYLGRRRDAVVVRGAPAIRLLLVGGEPLGEAVSLWWNYAFRTNDELRAAVTAWNSADGERFGPVVGSPSPRVPSPVFQG